MKLSRENPDLVCDCGLEEWSNDGWEAWPSNQEFAGCKFARNNRERAVNNPVDNPVDNSDLACG